MYVHVNHTQFESDFLLYNNVWYFNAKIKNNILETYLAHKFKVEFKSVDTFQISNMRFRCSYSKLNSFVFFC